MKLINLTKGKCTVVDDEDFLSLSKYKWSTCEKRKGYFYAVRSTTVSNGKQLMVYMHRQLMNFPVILQVDHINHNPLDNRKSNLRLVTHKQNNYNSSKSKANSSGYKGVWFDKDLNKYRAGLSHNNKTLHIGVFSSKKQAALAYNQKALELRGEYASLNHI